MSTNKILRWFSLLEILNGNPGGSTVVEILDQLRQLSLPRTPQRRDIERDLNEMLDSPELKIEHDEGIPRRWRISPAGKRPFAARCFLSVDGAVAIKVAEKHMAWMLPPAAYDMVRRASDNADQVLVRHADPALRQWMSKLRVLPHNDARPLRELPAAVKSAIYDSAARNLKLRLTYRYSQKTSIEVAVLGLVLRPSMLTVVVHDGQCLRLLWAHNIVSAETTTMTAMIPTGFDLDHWIENEMDTWPASDVEAPRDESLVVLHCDRLAADYWMATPLAQDQTISPMSNGRWCVRATTRVTDVLQMIVLGFGDRVELVEPNQARLRIADAVHRMAARYAEASNGRETSHVGD